MEIKARLEMKLRTDEAIRTVKNAAEAGLRDTVADITRDVIIGSPVETGNNRRSVQYTVEGLDADIFSTSGYGGYLETGTYKMVARPYFRPALDRNIGKLPVNVKTRIS